MTPTKLKVVVVRQWLGRIGKVDNGQVAVFATLTNAIYTVPVDARLCLPGKWIDDPERCDKAAYPKPNRSLKPSVNCFLEKQTALEMAPAMCNCPDLTKMMGT